MISFSNMDEIVTDASGRNAMAEIGITQAGLDASTQARRQAGAVAMEASLDGTTLGKNPRLSANPLNIGPIATANYQQPNTAAPAAGAATVQVEAVKNPLGIVSPVPAQKYVQPGTSAPPAPAPGQLSTLSYGSIGVSGAVRADGSRIF